MLMPPFRGLIDCSARRMTAQVQLRAIYHTPEKFSTQGGECNRISVIETFERHRMFDAAEFLYDGRARLGTINLARPAAKT